jgi:hypothetical protein
VQDVTVRFNNMKNTVGGVSVASRVAYGTNALMPSQPSQRISFQNNLFEQIGSGNMFGLYGDLQNLSLVHNTAFAANAMFMMDGSPENGFYAVDNVMSHGSYGLFGASLGEGNLALSRYVPGATIVGNVLFAGYDPANYPTGNYFPTTISAVGFSNYSGGDFSLSSSSPYKGKATNGTDPGVDFNLLRTAIAGVVQP